MIDSLTELDTGIFLYLNSLLRCSFMDKAMTMFTERFVWVPMYVAILVLFARPRRWSTFALLTIGCSLAIVIADQTCATLIRPYVERLRPSNPDNPVSVFTLIVNGYRGGPYGFPSCHAANSFALATFTAFLVRKRGFTAFIFGWAIINSYSRIYLGVHYPGDLLAGAIIGSIAGFLCLWIAEAATHKFHIIDRTQSGRPLFFINRDSGRLSTPVTAANIVEITGIAIIAVIIILAA